MSVLDRKMFKKVAKLKHGGNPYIDHETGQQISSMTSLAGGMNPVDTSVYQTDQYAQPQPETPLQDDTYQGIVSGLNEFQPIANTFADTLFPTKSAEEYAEEARSLYQKDFTADAVLYDRTLPNFSKTDQLNVATDGSNVTTATCPQRRFSGVNGVKVDTILGYSNSTSTDPVYNVVSAISGDGGTVTLTAAPADVTGICDKDVPGTSTTVSSTFTIKVPKIVNFNRSGLYSRLPKKNISTVDLSDSNLIVSRQVSGKSLESSGTYNGNLVVQSSQVFESSGADGALGITTAFFEPFDAERYSIHYNDGTIEKLTSDRVEILSGGSAIRFNVQRPGEWDTANPSNQGVLDSNITVNVTMKKLGLSSKGKTYNRSAQLEVTSSVGLSTFITQSNAYGLRVEDKEISLNVPDAVKVHAVLESTDNL